MRLCTQLSETSSLSGAQIEFTSNFTKRGPHRPDMLHISLQEYFLPHIAE